VPFPFGVALIMRDSLPRTHLEEVAMFGRNYSGQAAVEAGLVHEVRPKEAFQDYCLERLEELASKDLNALAITKRYLRAATVERIRAADSRLVQEFVDSWFRPETQERIHRIVDELQRT
jgi:enoyl-CoA hydratase/carnithine racemase